MSYGVLQINPRRALLILASGSLMAILPPAPRSGARTRAGARRFVSSSPGPLWVETLTERGEARDVQEVDGDLLSLPSECTRVGEDLVGEMAGCVGLGRIRLGAPRVRNGERVAAAVAGILSRLVLESTALAVAGQARSALCAEAAVDPVLVSALRTAERTNLRGSLRCHRVLLLAHAGVRRSR
jgi:hypothetical protein